MNCLRIPRTRGVALELLTTGAAQVAHSRRNRQRKYFATPIRLCREEAIALVKFAGVNDARRVCGRHASLEASDRPREIEWFEDLMLREHHPALELLEKVAVNRAPRERSWEDQDQRDRRRKLRGRM